ncbi:phage tail tape measure protein [Pseudomonas helleri]|uniref:Phage tail tape measure protein n=1 Tax=Pseudomonas helleri TaxID=1608996 RepID=A0A7X1WCC9_9PSED|nr:neuraminidase-like domain-containing protein [Pseudomonas helleri]MQT49252.1 phage tail tape measure protein [Pseudomonas helleri]
MPHTLDQQLNEKLRDAQLAFYLAHALPEDAALKKLGLTQTLKTAEDLYTHWLLDVLVSQAVPTSRVACAIASLQQYINGISLGLEPGYETEGMSPAQLTTWQDTLHTYSIWHAHQQLRYYPSTFLNPELRRNKTDNFQQLENDINQSRIQSSTVLSAVQSYLGRFEDIANLTTLNGYIDGDITNMANSTYYFVGKSRAANTYYWRSLDMAKRAMHPSDDGTRTGKKDTPEASAWSDWQKIPLPASDNIPDRSVRPVFFNNRLFIIWAQVIKPTPSLSEPAHLSDLKSDEDYQQYKARSEPFLKTRFSKISLNFIYQKYDGSWSLPQVCIDEYNTLKVSAEGINAATTTIATLDSTTSPPSLFLGLHIKGVKNGTYQTTTELAQGFYQAVRLDLQFGIKPLYSSGTLLDFFAYPEHREVAIQYGTIFADHNELNFNFHAPTSQIIEVEHFKNERHNTNSDHWNFENKQEHIKDISNKSELRFNTTTGALEVKSGLAKDFPKYQKLSFSSNYTSSEVWLELVVNFSNIEQPSVKLQPGSSITFKQQGFAGQYLQNIDIINTRNRQKISILSVSPDKKKLAKFLTGDNQATLDLQDLQIDKDIFTQLHSANAESYSISVDIASDDIETPNKTVSFDNLTTSAFNRTYKQIIIIPLNKETPTPPKINRLNTLIIGEEYDEPRRYLKATSIELKSEQSTTSQVRLDVDSLRPYAENKAQLPIPSEQSEITFLHGVAILEVNVRYSQPYLLGYALKALTVTLDKNAKAIIPLAPKLKRITSNTNSTTECIDFSGSIIELNDSSQNKQPREPIRMNTGFAETLTKAANVSLEALFSLPPDSWLEAPLTENGNSQPLDFHGAHGKYYWELFLYLPWLVAYRLNMEQRYAEAQKWLHYFFNPGSKTNPEDKNSGVWRLKVLTAPISEPSYARDNPYDPNQIALSAPVHFRQALYQLYLDILINRGDAAYRQMTADSMAEAKLWYVRAKRLLGPRPDLTSVDSWTNITLKNFSAATSSELRKTEANVNLKDVALVTPSHSPARDNQSSLTADTPHFLRPLNPALTARWDKIDSRLHNLRHHLDLAGKPLQLSLYASPLSPHALLSRAAQGGNSHITALHEQQIQAGHYRFQVTHAQAMLAADNLIQFGNTLLSLLERKEQTEQIAQQYAHAWDLSAVAVEQQAQALLVDEKNQLALRAGRRVVEARTKYFEKQLLEGINPGETRATQEYQESAKVEIGAYAAQAAAGIAMLLPNIFGTSNGGMRFEGAAQAVQATLQSAAHIKRSSALHLERTEQFNRRNQEWSYALEQAQLELSQIDAQLETYAEQTRVSRLQLRHTETALIQAKATYETLSKRFCSVQLYQWLNNQLSTFYFQAYDMAHSLCLVAQACWQFEQADYTRTFIQNTLWNNQYRGLAAGESLKLNLLQMSTAYLQHNQRALEISKTISLRQLHRKDSGATLNQEWSALKTDLLVNGTVDFELTQALFDADYPGHYLRRIKSISVSLPATLAPYENIRATLTQTYNKIQFSEAPDSIKENLHVHEEIALSTGLNDSGLFTLNFDHDERYLPFEYTGAVSRWQLAFPNPKDQATLLDSLTDIIVHVRYTAITGGRA